MPYIVLPGERKVISQLSTFSFNFLILSELQQTSNQHEVLGGSAKIYCLKQVPQHVRK